MMKTKKERKEWEARATGLLHGRSIEGIDWNWFSDGRGGYASAPVLRLRGGVRVSFRTIETESGAYGVNMSIIQTERPD